MARSLPDTILLHNAPQRTDTLRSAWVLQLVVGFIVLFGTITFFLGTAWDIQWHNFIGRDRTLIPPHIMMLCGVAISGIAALTSVLIESIQVRRGSIAAGQSTRFADIFYGSLGAYIAGFGALTSAIAFPLDSYWHALYGIDVALWAPFHIMIIGGMAIAALGAAYMLIAVAHKVAACGANKVMMAGYIGTLVACATMINILVFLVFDGLSGTFYITLPGATLTVFPFLMGILGAWAFVMVTSAVPLRWAATITCGFSFLLVLIVAVTIPSAMDLLMSIEHLTFRAVITHDVDPHLPIVALQWVGISFLLPAILLDVFAPIIRRKNWTRNKQLLLLALITLLGCIPIAPAVPLLTVQLFHDLGIGFLISLFIGGLLGTLIGSQLGRGMGETMQLLER